jgi:hypothetical protein
MYVRLAVYIHVKLPMADKQYPLSNCWMCSRLLTSFLLSHEWTRYHPSRSGRHTVPPSQDKGIRIRDCRLDTPIDIGWMAIRDAAEDIINGVGSSEPSGIARADIKAVKAMK